MAELVDAPDLGSGAFGREGSTPFARTIFKQPLHPFRCHHDLGLTDNSLWLWVDHLKGVQAGVFQVEPQLDDFAFCRTQVAVVLPAWLPAQGIQFIRLGGVGDPADFVERLHTNAVALSVDL